jgi:hypothetical protein
MRLRLLSVSVLLLLASLANAQQAQQRRIVRPIDNASVVRLAGTTHPRTLNAVDRGPVSPTMQLQRMRTVFSPSAEQQSALDQLLAEQQDRNSPNYHKWLTPEEFGDRFGLAQADIVSVSAWLNAQGFTVEEIARGRNWIAFSGTAAQVEAAFRAPIHNYLVGGKTHFAISSDISIPEAFSGVVTGVTGLHDFAPRPRNTITRSRPRLTSSITGNHFLVPGDFATIYNLPSYTNGAVCTSPCTDGTGQTIAVMGQTDLSTDSNPGRNGTPGANGQQYDLVTFRNLAGLPPVNLQIVVNGTDPGLQTGDVDEANLDIEWAGATAPNAKLIYVITSGLNNGSGAFGSLIYAVNNNLAPVITISYGECEVQAPQSDLTSLTNAGQQANTQGQAIVAPSGDSGATDCDTNIPATAGLSVDLPASMPYVTAIGGTVLSGDSTNSTDPTQPTQYWAGATNDIVASAFSYIPESAWNDSSGATTGPIAATGGGASVKFTPKPIWQTGPGVPNDGARDVPDVSFAAAPSPAGYLICSQSSCVTNYRNTDTTFFVIGGTSAGTPSFAGILALINQVKGIPQGNINAQLYSFVQTYPLPGNPNTSWVFNDITTGDNKVVCTVGTTGCSSSPIGYAAGPGYDLVTGLGTVDATALINALTNSPNPSFLVLPVSRSIALAASSSSVVAVSVTPKQGFNSTVALTCTPSSSLTAAGVSCSYDNSNVAAPGTANLTIQSGTQTSVSGTVTLQGTSGSVTNSVVMNVSVGIQDFQITSGNATETVTPGGSTTDTITITPLQGFTGSVSFTCTGTTGLTCSLSPNPVTATTPSAASTLTVNAAGTATTGSVTITASSGALTHNRVIPVTVTAAAPNFTLTVASPVVSIPSGTALTTNLTVAAVGSFNSDVALACTVPSSLSTTTCSINPPTAIGGNGTSVITIQGAVLSRDRGAPFPFQHRGLGTYATFVFALGMVFTARPARRRGRRALRNGLFGLFLLCVMFGALSCGGGNNGGGGSGPTPITGNITITGTGGGVTNTTTINVTVH